MAAQLITEEFLSSLVHDGSEQNLGKTEVDLIQGSSLKPEPIDWLWGGWLAGGKFHVLAGAPGTGKTTIALALAATVTTGGRWPDGTQAPRGNVLIWSGEDDPKDTLVPRLIAAGADMSQVFFVGDVTEAGERRSFDPATDIRPLARKAAAIGGVKLLIVDPIVSAVGGDSHKNAEVRRGLQPLVELGAMLGAAVLGISHFSKSTAGRDPVERVTGSIAFGALARVVMASAKLPDDDQEGGGRIFCRSKSNIGPDGGGFRYDLAQTELTYFPGVHASYVLWGTFQNESARELLGQPDSGRNSDSRSKTDEAEEWLREMLRDGPMKASDAQKEARQAGIGEKPLRRAYERLGIKTDKQGFTGGWLWAMPGKLPVEDAQEGRTCHTILRGSLGQIGHLGEDCSEEVEVEI